MMAGFIFPYDPSARFNRLIAMITPGVGMSPDCPTEINRGSAPAGVFSGRTNPEECPDQYPANLLSHPFAAQVNATGGNYEWWLAHTRPRQEKLLAAALLPRRVPYYLPLVTRKSLSRGRTRVARIPLFPGYVFVYGGDEERAQVLKTNRVPGIRLVSDGESLRADLLRFAELIASGAPLVPEARLVTGNRVRVKAGPFRGQEGVVLRRNGKTRLLIAVNYLQRGASLQVDDCMLEYV
jgi:transcription antitermination factor NusG